MHIYLDDFENDNFDKFSLFEFSIFESDYKLIFSPD